jgi:hypothetical protein
LLILLSGNDSAAGRAFALGWTGSLAMLALVPIIAHVRIDPAHPPTALRAAGLSIGFVFLLAALLAWTRGPGSAEEQPRHALLARIDGISQPRAAALAVGLAALNAKDAALSLAAGAAIAGADPGALQATLSLAAFVALASVSVIAPLALRIFARERVEPALRRSHEWLERNGHSVGASVLAVSGLVLLATALA